MKKVMNNFPVMFLLFILTTCGGGGGGENGDKPDDDIVLDPSVSEEALASCQMREKLVGLWEQDSVTDGDLTFNYVKIKFGHYGEFFYRAHEQISGNVLILQGGYSITSSDTLHLKYRSQGRDNDDDVLAEEIVEEDVTYTLTGDILTLEFEDAPVHHLKRFKAGENSNSSGGVPYASIADGANQFIVTSEGHPFRKDGLCTADEQISEEWNPEGYCIEEEIRGNWYLAFPEYHGGLALDAIKFERAFDTGETSSFEWRYVSFFNFDESPFAPVEPSSNGDVGQIFENPVPSSNDDNIGEENTYRYRFSTGTYTFINESTIELTYDRDDLGLHNVGDVERYIVQYNKAADHMSLVSFTGKKLLVGRAHNPLDYNNSQETNHRRQDGVCSGTPIVDACPTATLLGRWELPTYYKDLYAGKQIILGDPYYDFNEQDYIDGLILDPFDWLNFYDNGTVRVYRDGNRIKTFYFQVSPCANCWEGDWTLSLASFKAAFEDDYIGPVPRYDIPMEISEKALSLMPHDDVFYDEEGNRIEGIPVVLPIMNRPSVVQPVECVEEE